MALKDDLGAMTLSVVPGVVNLTGGNPVVKSLDEFIFSLICSCVVVDVILLYCSLWAELLMLW